MATRIRNAHTYSKPSRQAAPTRDARRTPRTTTIPRRVLVATDGSRASAAAIRLASRMDQDGLWRPEALTIVEHAPIAVADIGMPSALVLPPVVVTDGAIQIARSQLDRLGGKAWPLRSAIGGAAFEILNTARELKSELIVLGMGKHGRFARLLGAETAARVCRHAGVPVVVANRLKAHRPSVIVVGMDFGSSSMHASRVALEMLAPGGRLHLLNVRFGLKGQRLRDEAWETTYALGAEQAFKEAVKKLKKPGVRVTWELRYGGIMESMLDSARELNADMVAIGSHNQTAVDRMLLGSTPAVLLRTARCSVLVAPPTG